MNEQIGTGGPGYETPSIVFRGVESEIYNRSFDSCEPFGTDRPESTINDDVSVKAEFFPTYSPIMNTPVSRLIRSDGQVVSVRAEVTVDKAVDTMVDLNVGSIVVLDSEDILIGIFTERDLLRRVVGKNLIPGKTTIESVMTRNVHVVDRSADRRDVHQLMDSEHIRHVPIVDGGTVLGVVSLRDVLRSENAEKDFELTQLRDYVTGKPYPSYPG